MSRPKIFARFRHTYNPDKPVQWLTRASFDLGTFTVTNQQQDAYDFALECDQYSLDVSEAFIAADEYRANLDWEIEIVMIRDYVETIIDMENGMQMLALAALE